MNISYYYCLLGCGFLVPLGIIIFCYVNIVRAVVNQHKEMSKHADKLKAKTAKEEKERKQEIQTAKIAATTIGLFLLSWLPYTGISLLGILGFDQYVTPLSCMLPVLFAKTSAMYNPLVYALSHPRYRAALCDRFPSLACIFAEKETELNHSGSTQQHSKPAGGRKALARSDSEISSDMSEVDLSSVGEAPANRISTNPGGGKGKAAAAATVAAVAGAGRLPPRPQPPQAVKSQPPNSPNPVPATTTTTSANTTAPANISEQIKGDQAMHTLKHLEEAYKGLKALAAGGTSRKSSLAFQNPAYEPDAGVTIQGDGVYYTGSSLGVHEGMPLRRLSVPQLVPCIYPGYLAPGVVAPIAGGAPVVTETPPGSVPGNASQTSAPQTTSNNATSDGESKSEASNQPAETPKIETTTASEPQNQNKNQSKPDQAPQDNTNDGKKEETENGDVVAGTTVKAETTKPSTDKDASTGNSATPEEKNVTPESAVTVVDSKTSQPAAIEDIKYENGFV